MKHDRLTPRVRHQGVQQHDLFDMQLRSAQQCEDYMGFPIQVNGLMLKKYEVVRFMVDMPHAISALRAVEVACAHHVMISARSAGTSPTVSYRFHRELIESNCQLQRTIVKKLKVFFELSQRIWWFLFMNS